MRVVSLLPGATEIIAALAADAPDIALVGITHECDFPASVRSLPRVTTSAVHTTASPATIDAEVRALASAGTPLFQLDESGIARLQPDVLVTQALCDVCAVSETDVRALAARLGARGAHVPRVVTLGGTTLDGVFDDVRCLATELGCATQGEMMVEKLRNRLRAVHDRLKSHRAPRPRMAIVEWTEPLYAAGHWVPELVHRAGGVDVLATPGAHSRMISVDDLVAADPEIVCVAPCGFDVSRAAVEARRLLARDDWQRLRHCTHWALDANSLTSRAGPRLVEAVDVLAAIGNPALFPPIPSHLARPVTIE